MRITVGLLLAWIVSVGVGVRVLWQYSETPSELASPPASWPRAVAVNRTDDRSSLLLFAHPECPCSRASIGELERIMVSGKDRLDATVLFAIPTGDPMGWSGGSLMRAAGAIPGVRVVQDTDGVTARRFGARTSGQTLFYDAQGRLAFNGGITASRGHSGDNNGRDAIVALLREHTPSRRSTPVFGCALYSGQ
jgi:hypothetical protein